jgi:phosphoribosylanthranilate isomerase
MRVRVKICGIRKAGDAATAVRAGADALGFVFSPSPRRIAIVEARAVALEVPPFVATVAVLWNPVPQELAEVLRDFGPDVVQCEPEGFGREAAGARTGFLAVLHDGPDVLAQARALPRDAAVLLEAPGHGGRGVSADWGRAATVARERTLVLAGGLTPENVGDAIRAVRPYAVDVSSGVESSAGVKDPVRIARFLAEVRHAGDALDDGGGATWSRILGC